MQKPFSQPASKDLPFWKFLVVINSAVPLALLAIDAVRGQLGANAVNFAIHTTGILSLLFMVLSLAVTPLRRLTGWNSLVAFRRSLGLFAFFYAVIHVAIYVGFDRALSVTSTMQEVLKRRYLQVGLLAVVLMLPLAVTSTNAMISRLGGKRWKLLHRLAYLAAGLGALHYFLLVKSDVRQPLAFAGVLAVLLMTRLVWHYLDLRKAAQRFSHAPLPPANRKFWTGELQLVAIFDETPEVRTFRLMSPTGGPLPFDYRPGQYLNLQLLIDGQRVNRSYTIASSPTRNGYCEVSIKREDTGLASLHLHRTLRVGDRLRVSAPAGKFVFAGEESDSVVLIAGGVGITPMMSITRYLTDRGWTGDIFFFILAKTPRDIIFRDELLLLQKRFPNLHVHITLTRVGSDDAWNGRRGRLDEGWLNYCVPELASRRVYLCGPDDMMAATHDLLVTIGVDAANIHREAFVSPGVSSRLVNAAPVMSSPRNGRDGGGASEHRDTNGGDEPPSDFESATATFARSAKSTVLSAETTLLEASELAGVDLPFECRSGICGQCKIKLLAGAVMMDAEDALSPAEKATGWVLACQSRCRGDVTVDA
jgi:ferredoxin-NADP reductase/DMSO/TMAO reductase YedYZ heme-binding membrane subunit